MLGALFFILLVLWFLGYVRIEGLVIPDPVLFSLNGTQITIFKTLIMIVIMWAIEALPTPLRQIAVVILLLWVLSTLGIIAIANFSSLLILALIIGLGLSLLSGH